MGSRPQDVFGKRAKTQGYPARSVYKLEEMDRRLRLFRRGQRVLDLGAAPGSWTVYASQCVGPKGSVIGVDVRPTKAELPANVTMREADALTISAQELGGCRTFDVVLSDMAPSTSGVRSRDQYLSYELFMCALNLACQVLKPMGSYLGKLFQGPEFEDARRATAASFHKVRILKPEASRKESYEVFVCGLRLK